MPNERLNSIVAGIDGKGVVHYSFRVPPQLIVRTPERLRLERPSYILGAREKIASRGYRHCPTHWEWVLMLRPHKGAQFVVDAISAFQDGRSCVADGDATYISPPAFDIVVEQNQWTNKGGSPEQVSVYLEAPTVNPQRFSWLPTPIQLSQQLRLAFDLYGWGGKDGLEREIFSRI